MLGSKSSVNFDEASFYIGLQKSFENCQQNPKKSLILTAIAALNNGPENVLLSFIVRCKRKRKREYFLIYNKIKSKFKSIKSN